MSLSKNSTMNLTDVPSHHFLPETLSKTYQSSNISQNSLEVNLLIEPECSLPEILNPFLDRGAARPPDPPAAR
ncbi:hypothetical protein J2129_002649 [Methanofollis sp. W23]|nr:hypothetical protein [Methanofollis sp. W23]